MAVIYQESWLSWVVGWVAPRGLLEVSLTDDALSFRMIIPPVLLVAVPIAQIRRVEIVKGFVAGEISVSYLSSPETLGLASFNTRHVAKWTELFQGSGIQVFKI